MILEFTFVLDSFHLDNRIKHFQGKKNKTLKVVGCENNYRSKPVIFKENDEIYKHILATKTVVLRIPHLL